MGWRAFSLNIYLGILLTLGRGLRFFVCKQDLAPRYTSVVYSRYLIREILSWLFSKSLKVKQMKKIKSQSFSLGNAQGLSRQQMKNVMGGAALTTTCSTTCGGYTLSITNCNGDCLSQNGKSVTCQGGTNTLTKNCTTTVPPAGGNPPA
jgi:hypothetical protein